MRLRFRHRCDTIKMSETNPVTVWTADQAPASDHSSQIGNPVTMQTAVTTEKTALKRASFHSG